MVFAGVRRPATGWPRGQYRGEYVVRRDGQEVLARNFAFSL
jgi:hypothetical protein